MGHSYIIVLKLSHNGNEYKMIRDLGYKIISISTELTLEEVMEVEVPIEIDLNNEDLVIETVRELAEKYKIVSVFTLNEYRVPLAAKIRESLGLPYGISYQAANICRNKKETRKVLTDTGVNSVQYQLVKNVEEALGALKRIPLPVVIKPSNDAGSKMVQCCETVEEVVEAIQNIKSAENNVVGQKLDQEILLEEFLTGPEYSVETYTFNNNTQVLAITAKKVLSPFMPVEIGHTVPAKLNVETQESIRKVIENAIEAIGIDYSITHIEVKLTSKGPKIIEINARPGGDEIPTLVEMTTGYNLHRIALQISLGIPLEKYEKGNQSSKSAAIRFVTANREGMAEIVNQNRIFIRDSIVKSHWNIESGEYISKTTCNYDRLGYFIVGDIEDKADMIAEDILDSIEINIQ